MQVMGMNNGPRKFQKKLPKIQEDEADINIQNISSSEEVLVDSNDSEEDKLLIQSNVLEKKKEEESK